MWVLDGVEKIAKLLPSERCISNLLQPEKGVLG